MDKEKIIKGSKMLETIEEYKVFIEELKNSRCDDVHFDKVIHLHKQRYYIRVNSDIHLELEDEATWFRMLTAQSKEDLISTTEALISIVVRKIDNL